MAVISTNTILDEVTARTAGEAWTINSGASLTIKTDTRVHAKAPTTTGTGSLGSITINEGECIIDATTVRWLAYTGGTGNVPAIGTIISQGGASGYMLGVWANLTSLATASGSAMPSTGYIKFRQVTGGVFSTGILTGISATSSGSDVTGWIEVVCDQAANIVVPRLGTFTTRGDYFYLDATTGVRGQVLQAPTNGGGVNTYVAGVEIESSAGSGVYELYPALYTSTNGWAVSHLGQAKNESDKRQMFVKMLQSGQMQIGERITQTGTYAYTASQTSTYASSTRAGYYWRINNRVEVYCAGGHYLNEGMQTGFDATSGTASDGIVTPLVHNPYWFSFDQVGANTEGTCNCIESVAVTFTAHGLNIGEKVYLTPTTGTLPAGVYEIVGVPSANGYQIKYPHIAALTSGSAGALHNITVTTSAAHGLAIGNRVYADFTTGTGVDGAYTIRTVPSTTTYTINCPLSATTSGNITTTHDLGYVPPVGCKTRIPNIIMRQVDTGTRATNAIPNATVATRPEFITTSAGKVDMEYVTSDWYFSFIQAYGLKLKNCHTFDSIQLSEIATAFSVDNCLTGMVSALDIRSLQCTSNFAGGYIKGSFSRGNVTGSSDHNVEVTYCNGIEIEDTTMMIEQYARSSGFPLIISASDNITVSNCKTMNGPIYVSTSANVAINNTDYCDRVVGYTSATAGIFAVAVDTRSSNVVVDGVTFGLGGTVQNCHPQAAVVRISGSSTGVTFRNLGTSANPLKVGTWNVNAMGLGSILSTAGNCFNYRIQNCFCDSTRSSLITTTNSDKGVVLENVHRRNGYQVGTFAVDATAITSLNCDVKNYGMINETIGQASVYGTHFRHTSFNGFGRLVLAMNEPTVESSAVFSNVTGSAKFNSSGGILQDVLGSQNVWESNYWLKGITGFEDYEGPVLSGSTQSWYLIEYALDTGSGYGAWHNFSRMKGVASGVSGQYTITIADTSGLEVGDYVFGGTNLGYRNKITNINGTTITMSKPNRGTASGTVYFSKLPEEVTPASGFKIKVRVTTTTTATTAITFLRFTTKSTYVDTFSNTYPLDVITLTLSGLVSGSDIVILQAGTEVQLEDKQNNNSTSYNYVYETAQPVDIGVFKEGYVPFYIRNYSLGSTNASLPIAQVADRNYI